MCLECEAKTEVEGLAVQFGFLVDWLRSAERSEPKQGTVIVPYVAVQSDPSRDFGGYVRVTLGSIETNALRGWASDGDTIGIDQMANRGDSLSR